jgi:hypothetical protein
MLMLFMERFGDFRRENRFVFGKGGNNCGRRRYSRRGLGR